MSVLLHLVGNQVISGSEDFWTCLLHQVGHLNFHLLHNLHFSLFIIFRNVQSFCLHKTTFLMFYIAFASISSAFSVASFSGSQHVHIAEGLCEDKAGLRIMGWSGCLKGQTKEVADRNSAKTSAYLLYNFRFWFCNFWVFLMLIYVILSWLLYFPSCLLACFEILDFTVSQFVGVSF